MVLPEVCVVYLLRDVAGRREVLLGRKLTGLGLGKLVAPGGKLKVGESPTAAAVREVAEEVGLSILERDLEPIGRIDYYFPHRPEWSQRSWAFRSVIWKGAPASSIELEPEWFGLSTIPFDQMWSDAVEWLPRALGGEYISAEFDFESDNDTASRRAGVA